MVGDPATQGLAPTKGHDVKTDVAAVNDAIDRLPIAAWYRLQALLEPAAREWQLAHVEAENAYVRAKNELLCQGKHIGPAVVEFYARSGAAWAAYRAAKAKALEAVRAPNHDALPSA